MLEPRHLTNGDSLRMIPRERECQAKAALEFMQSVADGDAILPISTDSGTERMWNRFDRG